ncbi:hypothetical protein H2198_002932 [Neophaeococcomyces mojaviensis]|uniref:Uncharacterized protein n=1 Tax=Neophaeococcomyces mojaviensis TaxID=3383035 RepID=A0ACC3AD33_9EURO|nr:hypothetical protein H2198_002932 [Knufia sp. JES_112]
MSAEDVVTDALQKPVDANEVAAEDARKMLAEIEAEEAGDVHSTMRPENNGAANGNKEQSSEAVKEDNTEKTDEQSDDQGEQDEKDEQDEQGEDRKGKDRDRKYNDRRDSNRRDGGHRGGRGDRGGRGGKFNNRGIKSVLTQEEKSSDPAAIRKQVDFYFSDSNLPMDQFLLDKVGGSKNNAVELDIICTFKRMRHFEPREAVVEALRSSKVVKLVDNDTKVQRKQPLAESTDNGVDLNQLRVYEDKAMPRSVYVKGFGEEVPSTQFDIEAFFAEHGPTNAIRLRRTETKSFKGSVFVEFESEELAKNFLALDPKPQYKGRDLQIMSKQEYCEKKVDDIKAGKIKPQHDRDHPAHRHRGGRGSGRGGRGRDSRRRDDDNRDWRVRRDEDQKHGFRDDKRRDNRDRKSGGKEYRKSEPAVDERGIPVVKTSEPDKPNKDSEVAKQEALAKARAMVEADKKKQEVNGADKADVAVAEVETRQEKNGEVKASKKREREDDSIGEPSAKKVDTKEDA